jgi:hypothetical protein
MDIDEMLLNNFKDMLEGKTGEERSRRILEMMLMCYETSIEAMLTIKSREMPDDIAMKYINMLLVKTVDALAILAVAKEADSIAEIENFINKKGTK